MSNSIPKQNLPLRVVLHRVGEATFHQYQATQVRMNSPEAAYRFWQDVVVDDPCFEPDKEHLVVVLLNTKGRTMGYHVVSVGSLNEAIAHPREIFRAAILAGAHSFILMHNHPSGDSAPSAADRRVTRKVQDGAKIMDIGLTDHVIVGAEAGATPYFSFKEAGLL